MHAIRLHEYGPAENLRWEATDDPVPGAGQVRIEVAAAGVHLIETWVRGGAAVGGNPQPALPWTPGNEVAGSVDAVGAGIDPSWIGRAVVARLAGGGGHAERAVADVDALVDVPPGLDLPAAVALIGTGATAMAIADLAQVTADDVVLVSAAAGGIGSLLVQMARAAGATVIGAAGGSAKVDLVRELGADRAVDYDVPDWAAGLEGQVSLVLDGVGGLFAGQAYRLLHGGGRLVSFGAASRAGELVRPEVPPGVVVQTLFDSPVVARLRNPRDTAVRARALEAGACGRLRPVLTTFPLGEAAAAHAALESRRTMGKVVLVTGHSNRPPAPGVRG